MTTNADFVPLARRHRRAPVVYLRTREAYAAEALQRALDWLAVHHLPDGRVLRVPRNGEMVVMTPLAW